MPDGLRPLAVLLVVALGLALFTSQGGTSPPTSLADQPRHRPPVLVGGRPASDAELARIGVVQAAAARVESVAREKHAEAFGGIRLTKVGQHMVVQLTEMSPDRQAALRRVAPEVDLSFAQVEVSEAQLYGLQDEVLAAEPALRGEGVHVVGTMPDIAKGVVRVAISQEPAPGAGSAAVQRRFGDRVIAEAQTQPPELLANRLDDFAPYSGGTFLMQEGEEGGAGTCTGGVPVRNIYGSEFLITAGHCFDVAPLQIVNYSPELRMGSYRFIGRVTARDLEPYGVDAELIHQPSSALGDRTYVGPTTSDTRMPFEGAGPTQYGSPVCFSGAFEGERCGVVQGVGGTRLTPYPDVWGGARWLSHLTYVAGFDINTIGQGDSGGPVYGIFGSTLKAVGIISGGDGNSPTGDCGNWAAQVRRKCYQGFWFTDIGPILTKWGLTVM